MAQSPTKRKTSRATPPARTPSSRRLKSTYDDSDIARRAYDLFLSRGYQHGRDVEDWLQAERELQHARRSTGARVAPDDQNDVPAVR